MAVYLFIYFSLVFVSPLSSSCCWWWWWWCCFSSRFSFEELKRIRLRQHNFPGKTKREKTVAATGTRAQPSVPFCFNFFFKNLYCVWKRWNINKVFKSAWCFIGRNSQPITWVISVSNELCSQTNVQLDTTKVHDETLFEIMWFIYTRVRIS